MTQRMVVVLVAAAVIFATAVAGQADDSLRWRIKQLQAELSRLQAQGADQAQLAADLDSERSQKDAALRTLASVHEQLRDAQASLVQGQEREAALQQALSQAQQGLAQAEAEPVDPEVTQHALASLRDELAGARSALAEEQEGRRDARRMLSGVRLAQEQASAAVVKLTFAQGNKDRTNAAAQAEMQAALAEAQQRQWQAESDLAELRRARATEVENERAEKDAARRGLASAQQQLRNAQAAMVQGQEREGALQQDLSQAQGRLARAEAEVADGQATRHALARLQDELAGARSALAEEREGHRSARSIEAGVRQALEQASAAVVKLRFAQARQNEANAAAQADLQQELLETQQRHWQAEEAIVSLRQELSQVQGDSAQVRQALQVEEAKGEATRLNLASAREELARRLRALEQEQGRNAAQGQVLANTQAALSETSATLAEANAKMAEQAESHASEQAASQSDKQQWVERYWDMERQGARTRAALRKEELAHQDTRQALDQKMRQAIASLRQELSQAQGDSAQVRQALLEEEAKGEATRLNLASTREELARRLGALEQEQGRNAAQGQVLANTQAALSETSGTLAEANAAMAEQAESHASEQAAAQSDKQQWVERYWDMEQQRVGTRAALRKEELAHQVTQQALNQGMRQAGLDGIRMSQLSRDAREARESLKRRLAPSAQARALADLVRQRFADEIQQGRMSVRVGRRDVKLSSADMFDFARAVEPGTQSVNTLNRIADILQEAPSHRVRFAVHTDNIPLRQGSKWPTNWELATARAAKLARYLIDNGVAGGRLSIAGYGEYRPVADNNTPEGRRQNRRVEVIIKAPRPK